MNQPTAIVQIQVLEGSTKRDQMPAIRNVTFEMSRETLGVMIDGLGKIKDQLAGVSQ